MIKNIFLMLLVCGVCFSCHSPQQEKQQEDLTKANKNMTNEQLREKLVMALGDMKAKAISPTHRMLIPPRPLSHWLRR